MGNSFIVLQEANWWLAIAAVAAAGLAAIAYWKVSYPWSAGFSWLLALLRFAGIFLLLFLLLNPLLRQLQNQTEDPVVAFVYDNSTSVALMTDSLDLIRVGDALSGLAQTLEDRGVESVFYTLEGLQPAVAVSNEETSSNLSSALSSVTEAFEGRNLAGMVFVSDGIYNRGISPTYLSYARPVYSIGVGDTVKAKDVAIQSVKTNAVAYQGNQFPVEVVIDQEGYDGLEKTVSLYRRGEVVQSERITDDRKISFFVEAQEPGLGRYTVAITSMEEETSYQNNSYDFYIDVIEGRERVLIMAPAPHPDISAIRNALARSENYEIELHIPGLTKQAPNGEYDVVIDHHAFSPKSPKDQLEGNPARWYILGLQSNITDLALATGIQIDQEGNQRDNVKASFNPVFSAFDLESDDIDIFAKYPPISVPFGEYVISGPVQVLIHQQVGSIVTKRPLLSVFDDGTEKSALMAGTGLWQWRILEGIENGDSENFDEMVKKITQFLSVRADKRKFRFQPRKSSYEENEAVRFDAELYNAIYERVYNNRIDVTVTDEDGEVRTFEYFPAETDGGFNMGATRPGVYQFTAATSFGGERYTSSGEFLVRRLNLESLNLTADHNILREISRNTGGDFYTLSQLEQVGNLVEDLNPRGVIRSSESFFPLVSSLLIFLAAIVIFTLEWFLRKYHGSY
ncbi:MAG: hypothetical protein AAGA85_18105 [Bacteroidota bacterium]